MEQRLTLHIVDSDSRSRAEQARTAFALGHHAEVYSDLGELLSRTPASGIILLRQQAMDGSPEELEQIFGEQGVWMPLIVCAEEPRIEQVVNAIKRGALDYLQLPLEIGRLARSLACVVAEAEAEGLARRRLAEARRRVVQLSKRERQVLELLSLGSSNKLIARELSISPRTVEIHRANMMTKLRAGTPPKRSGSGCNPGSRRAFPRCRSNPSGTIGAALRSIPSLPTWLANSCPDRRKSRSAPTKAIRRPKSAIRAERDRAEPAIRPGRRGWRGGPAEPRSTQPFRPWQEQAHRL